VAKLRVKAPTRCIGKENKLGLFLISYDVAARDCGISMIDELRSGVQVVEKSCSYSTGAHSLMSCPLLHVDMTY
jgi:hypothetical protein